MTGLDEVYQWQTVYAGIVLDYAFADQSLLTVNTGVTRSINPKVKVDFGGQFDRITLDLEPDYGLRMEISWVKPVAENLAINVGAFFEAWDFGASDREVLRVNGSPAGFVFQPASEAQQVGAFFSVGHLWQ